jgi:HAD superfamily hydrolase (TIGR01509 family)
MIEAVLFDFGNVLYRFDPPGFAARLAGGRGAASPEVLFRDPDPEFPHMAGRISLDGYRAELARRAGCAFERESFAEAYAGMYRPVPGCLALLRRLEGRVRLGLVSNLSEAHYERVLRPSGILPLFQAVALSFQVGVLKPEAGIYRAALERLELAPGACVFIDDLADNVRGARALGIQGLLFRGCAALAADLCGLGLLPEGPVPGGGA